MSDNLYTINVTGINILHYTIVRAFKKLEPSGRCPISHLPYLIQTNCHFIVIYNVCTNYILSESVAEDTSQKYITILDS